MSSNKPMPISPDFEPAGNSVHRFTRDSEFITVNPLPAGGRSVTVRIDGVESTFLMNRAACEHLARLLIHEAA